MAVNILRRLWWRIANWRFAFRALFKTIFFYTVALFICYPNPLTFLQQIHNVFFADTLIRTDFPAMVEINREIDNLLPANVTPEQEVKIVQNYVYFYIKGESDMENWGVLDFSPDAEQVWLRKRGDCEDQAVLAVSILRSRGFAQAAMVGNLLHVWAKVEDQEILGPLEDTNYSGEDGTITITTPAPNTILTAIAFLLTGFPVVRLLGLLFLMILLFYHPNEDLLGFLYTLSIAVVGFYLLHSWGSMFLADSSTGANYVFIIGLLLVGVSSAIAYFHPIKPNQVTLPHSTK